MLFLFYNADLVERKITNREGIIAFVNNYTAWVVGESAEANITSLRKVINYALAWESYNGATFKGKRTALVHFIRNPRLRSDKPLNIKGVNIQLSHAEPTSCTGPCTCFQTRSEAGAKHLAWRKSRAPYNFCLEPSVSPISALSLHIFRRIAVRIIV